MSKTKVIEVAQLDSVLEMNNHLKKKELELEKEKLSFERETKDRADISLKELEKLKQRNKELERENQCLKELSDKIFMPFFEKKIPQKVIEKLLNGEFETTIKLFEEPAALETTVSLTFNVKNMMEM